MKESPQFTYLGVLLSVTLILGFSLGCVSSGNSTPVATAAQISATIPNASTCERVSALIDRNTRRLNAHALVYENDLENPWNRISSQGILQNFAVEVAAAGDSEDVDNSDSLLIERLNAMRSILIPPGEPVTLSPELSENLSAEIEAFASLCRSASLTAPNVPYPGSLRASLGPKMPRNEPTELICETYGGLIDGYDELYSSVLLGLEIGPPYPIRILNLLTDAPEFVSLLDELLLLSFEQEILVDERLRDLTFFIQINASIGLEAQTSQDTIASAIRHSSTVVAAMDILAVSTLCAQAELPYAQTLEGYLY